MEAAAPTVVTMPFAHLACTRFGDPDSAAPKVFAGGGGWGRGGVVAEPLDMAMDVACTRGGKESPKGCRFGVFLVEAL